MKLKAAMTLAHLNLRREREGENDDGPLACDLKLTGDLDIGKLKKLFSNEDSWRVLLADLYDEGGELKTQDADGFKLKTESRACKAKIEYGVQSLLEFEGCVFGSIAIEPASGRVATLTCRLQVHPDDEQLTALSRLLKHKLDLNLNGATSLSDEGDDDQQKLPLGGGEREEPRVETAPEGEAAPSLTESLEQFDRDVAQNEASTANLVEAGIVKDNRGGKPSVHGEPVVEGQNPPQRPRPPKRGETLQ